MKDLDTWQVWEVFGSVWSNLLLLHKYSVIISKCQKVTFLEVEAKKKVEKLKLLEIAWFGEKIVRKLFLQFLTKFFFEVKEKKI